MLGLVASSAALAVTLAGCGADEVKEVRLKCDGFKEESAFSFCYFPEADGTPARKAQLALLCENSNASNTSFYTMVFADPDITQRTDCCATCPDPNDEAAKEAARKLGGVEPLLCSITKDPSQPKGKCKTAKTCKYQKRSTWIVRNQDLPCDFADMENPKEPDCGQAVTNLGAAYDICIGKGTVKSNWEVFPEATELEATV